MNKKYKFFIIGLLGFIIAILCITVSSFFLRNNTNYAAFIGSVLGAVISGVITFVVLFITIKQGNENQERALNTQSASQIENNLLHSLEKQKEAITESVNRLDDLLFTVQILKVSSVDDISEERKNLIEIFSDYRKAMNVIKLNTNVYIDTSKCDGCTDCDIKSYGELSKRKTKLCECFNKIEYNCSIMVKELQTALDESIDTQNLIAENNSHKKEMFSYVGLIQNCKENSVQNTNDNEMTEKIKQYAKLEEKIKSIDEKIQLALKDIGERNKKARNIAENIQMNERNELYNAAMKYFDIFNFYIKNNKEFVLNNGMLPIEKCKKYTLN
ncbi:MAG: hypothetical protein HDT39_14685 [Lachnospiraceae bacterium]|nr:hypothetical protein [Lachnospiraceae bacterium]